MRRRLDRGEVGVELLAPRLAKAAPVIWRGAGSLPGFLVRKSDVLKRAMQLVPLDLKRDQGRHEVVDVRCRRDQDGQRVLAVVVPAPATRRGLDRLPAHDLRAQDGLESLRALAHDNAAAAADRGRQPPHGVEQRTHIGLWLRGERVEDRSHPEMGLDQRLDLDVTRALQHGRVRAHVQLDCMLSAPTGSGRGLHEATIEPRPGRDLQNHEDGRRRLV